MQLRQHENKVLLVLTLIIGAIVRPVIVALILLTENLGARMYPAGGAAWRRIVVPVIGSLVTGYLLVRYFPDARGSGIPQTIIAFFSSIRRYQSSDGSGQVLVFFGIFGERLSAAAGGRNSRESRECKAGSFAETGVGHCGTLFSTGTRTSGRAIPATGGKRDRLQ